MCLVFKPLPSAGQTCSLRLTSPRTFHIISCQFEASQLTQRRTPKTPKPQNLRGQRSQNQFHLMQPVSNFIGTNVTQSWYQIPFHSLSLMTFIRWIKLDFFVCLSHLGLLVQTVTENLPWRSVPEHPDLHCFQLDLTGSYWFWSGWWWWWCQSDPQPAGTNHHQAWERQKSAALRYWYFTWVF